MAMAFRTAKESGVLSSPYLYPSSAAWMTASPTRAATAFFASASSEAMTLKSLEAR